MYNWNYSNFFWKGLVMKKLLKWICFLFWLGLIFYFSSQSGVVSSNTSSWALDFIRSIIPNSWFSNLVLDFTFLIRKSAHFCLYLLLGLFTFSLFKEYIFKTKWLYFKSFLFCVCYAISDEVHQLFVIGRSGRVFDVLVDSSGAFFGLFLLFLIRFFKIKKRAKN